MHWVFLFAAIVAEVVGTVSLRASEGFTKWLPSCLVVIGYGTSLFLLSLVLKKIPMGTSYAIWCGAGITLVTLVGAITYRQVPDGPAILGMSLIVAGVVILRFWSKSVV